MAGRVGASILDGVGMNVLIVRTLAEYEELAVLIASRKHLHHVRSACCMSFAACMLHAACRMYVA